MLSILSSENEHGAYFTVNTAVQSVPLLYDFLDPLQGMLYNSDFQSLFARLDHLTLISAGMVLPLNFQLWPCDNVGNPLIRSWLPSISIRTVCQDTLESNQFDFWLPFPDYELNIGQFKELFTGNVTTSFQLRMLINIRGIQPITTPRVSMLNVPDELNGLKFNVPVFAKVQHNIPISAIPV